LSLLPFRVKELVLGFQQVLLYKSCSYVRRNLGALVVKAYLRFPPLWHHVFVTRLLTENVRDQLVAAGRPAGLLDLLLQTAGDGTVQLPPELVVGTDLRAILE